MIDLGNLENFEHLVSAILDMAGSIKSLKPPSASDSVEKVVAWAQDVQRAFALLPSVPDGEMLLRFGEEVADSLGDVDQKIEAAKKPDEDDPWSGPLDDKESFWAILDDGVRSGTYPAYQFTYDFTEVEKTSTGYGTSWTALAGGRTGTARNGFDFGLNAQGGVPLQDGTLVRLWEVPVAGQTTLEYWFEGGYHD